MKTVSDERVVEFVSRECNSSFVPPMTCVGIEKDGEIIAGVIFNIFEGADVHVSVAGQGFTKGFLADVGRYCFDTLKCERMTAITEKTNVIKIAERLGGRIEGCLRNHFGKGRDGIIVGILKDEYKF